MAEESAICWLFCFSKKTLMFKFRQHKEPEEPKGSSFLPMSAYRRYGLLFQIAILSKKRKKHICAILAFTQA